jgi:hypothetical protein
MTLLPDWKRIVRRAWSIYAISLAAILTGCEAVLASFGTEWIPIPAWGRMLIIFFVMMAAFWLRLLAQKNLGN